MVELAINLKMSARKLDSDTANRQQTITRRMQIIAAVFMALLGSFDFYILTQLVYADKDEEWLMRAYDAI